MDHAGAVLIGTGVLMLFSRLIVAVQHRRSVRAALTQHHRSREPWRPALWLATTPRVRLALLASTGVMVCAFVPALTQRLLGPENPLVRASGVTLKWGLVMALLRTVRRWATNAARQRAGSTTGDMPERTR
eukprot:scaffold285439_cov36-Tisochrysis_lutea.AAC.1